MHTNALCILDNNLPVLTTEWELFVLPTVKQVMWNAPMGQGSTWPIIRHRSRKELEQVLYENPAV